MRDEILVAAGMLAAAQAVPAAAQFQRVDPLEELGACRVIANAEKRLACLDRASEALLTAVRAHRVVVLSQEEVAKTRESMFGFSIPDLKAFGSDHEKPAPPVLHLVGSVQKVRAVIYGKYDMQLDTGAVWRNIDLLDAAPLIGAKIRIDRTPFGGYIARLPFSASVHVQRVK